MESKNCVFAQPSLQKECFFFIPKKSNKCRKKKFIQWCCASFKFHLHTLGIESHYSRVPWANGFANIDRTIFFCDYENAYDACSKSQMSHLENDKIDDYFAVSKYRQHALRFYAINCESPLRFFLSRNAETKSQRKEQNVWKCFHTNALCKFIHTGTHSKTIKFNAVFFVWSKSENATRILIQCAMLWFSHTHTKFASDERNGNCVQWHKVCEERRRNPKQIEQSKRCSV